MQRRDFGYRRLSGRCWDARLTNDVPALLELAVDPAMTPDMVATIAPDARDHGAPAELIHLVLSHPACSVGVAGRFATHPDAAIRLRVARFPGLITSSLAVLAIDHKDEVRAAAVEALTNRAAQSAD